MHAMTITVENREIPVLLLTGYLGSGKTTLLNRILSNRKGIRFAVIVNDIGEVNIDADLIQKGGVVGQTDDSLVPLQNGCICCTLKMDLVNQLNDLCHMDRFDYIVIEASGICEPAPIARTITSFTQIVPPSAVTNVPKLDAIVTVVDALRMKEEFDCGDALKKPGLEEDDLETLVIQQVEFCNIVLLNKASEVSAEDRGRIRGIIKALNPKVQVYECDYGDVDLGKIVGTGLFDFDKVALSAAWISALEGDGDEEEFANEESGEALEYNISTYVYYRRPPLDISRFDYMVSRKWPSNIIRAKGLCYSLEIPMIAIPTLQIIAAGAAKQRTADENAVFCPMLDARRMEVFTALYDNHLQPLTEVSSQIVDEHTFADILTKKNVVFCGNAVEKCREILSKNPNALFDFTPISSINMVDLALQKLSRQQFEDIAYFEPFYLKEYVAAKPHVKGLV